MPYLFDATVHEIPISVEVDPTMGCLTIEGVDINPNYNPEWVSIQVQRAVETIANRFIGKRNEIRQEGYDEGHAAGLGEAAKVCQHSHDEGFKAGRADADANRAAYIEDARRKAHATGVKEGKAGAGTKAYIEDARRKAYTEGVVVGRAEISGELIQTYKKAYKAGQEAERTRLRAALGLQATT